MVRALSKDWGPKNIRINVLAPGVLDAGLSSVLPKRFVDDYLSHDALSRRGTMREACEVFTYFAVENTYVTGRSIAVDGGL
jgi:NAD(P)-dependent dehydrogenase (short-subunit alcohol dehydrogenase family)